LFFVSPSQCMVARTAKQEMHIQLKQRDMPIILTIMAPILARVWSKFCDTFGCFTLYLK
jgi:hypothetical protein